MPLIDLTQYIVASAGPWTDPTKDYNPFDFTLADTQSPGRLMLRWRGDFVALQGPLRVRVTVQAENTTIPLAYVSNLAPSQPVALIAAHVQTGATKATMNTGGALSEEALGRFGKGGLSLNASTIYSYTLDIPAGEAWPFRLSEEAGYFSSSQQLGYNLGYRVIIEPAFGEPKMRWVDATSDLPCDYAVANQPDTSRFFPAACEPCEGSVIGMPRMRSIALITPPAEGGCVRTRFFNGMFITREDLETEQRYHRLKSRLHNRASGAGVVWGLEVGKHGDSVRVLPGYGIDCCGNDLTLTTHYDVEIAALLADPAGAPALQGCGPQQYDEWRRAQERGEHRFDLLLEYVECPSHPRPVHGDQCAPEASRCEMSRIRESVRLRLVPPRGYNAAKESRPIYRFLEEVGKLRELYPIGVYEVVRTAAERAPFGLAVSFNNEPVDTANVVHPAQGTTSNILKRTERVNSIQVEAQLDPGWTFIRGQVQGVAPAAAATAVNPATPIDLSQPTGFRSRAQNVSIAFKLPETAQSGEFHFKLTGWQAQTFLAADRHPVPGGDVDFLIEVADGQLKRSELQSQINWEPLQLASSPCAGEPCGPGGADESGINAHRVTASDTTSLQPWLHPDPSHPSSAGDPKVLVLAALGSWLAEMMVRGYANTSKEVTTAMREVGQEIFILSWLFLFGISEKGDRAELGCMLQRLLEGWCDSLLWKGPQCCGDPHGVVIGCAVVEGGTIRRIDPFGGRRHVVHYPLLEHWGAQFGIAPPDITVSNLFSKLCCLAGLPSPSGGGVARFHAQSSAAASPLPDWSASLFRLGDGYLALGDPQKIAAKLDGIIVAKRNVSLPEMIASVVTLMSSGGQVLHALASLLSSPAKSTATQFSALVLDDFFAGESFALLVPAGQ
jgi:hypothetical protein